MLNITLFIDNLSLINNYLFCILLLVDHKVYKCNFA
jgi:hypothetical protein